MSSPASSMTPDKSNGGGKLRKEQTGDTHDESTHEWWEGEEGGMFGGLFERKKDKDGSKTSMSSFNSLDSNDGALPTVPQPLAIVPA